MRLEALPIIKNGDKTKRQGSGNPHIDYFGNGSAEKQSDGSDDLFGGADTGGPTIWMASEVLHLLTFYAIPLGPLEYWPNGYGN